MGDLAGQSDHGAGAAEVPAQAGLASSQLVAPGVSRLGHLPALDGLRGLAVTLVTLYHGTLWAQGGFLGVDVFFPLSGFLITSLLVRERLQTGGISLKHFYARRALRLLPALFLMLAVYLIVAAALDWTRIRMHLVDAGSTVLYAANIPRAMQIGRPVYLAPCWSLSLEEHFYLLWAPAMVWLSSRAIPPRRLATLLASAALLAWAYRVALLWGGASHQRLYYLLDTRADGFLLGAALGVLHGAGALPRRLGPVGARLTLVLSSAGLLGWGAMLLNAHYAQAANYSWRFSFIAVSTCLLVLHLLCVPDSPLARLLGARPLTALGRISYGVYLWHYPILISLARDAKLPVHVVTAVGIPLSVLAAALSYRLVELPALRAKQRFR